MEVKPEVPKKLKNAGVNPLDWPKVPDYVEDAVISAVNGACS